MSRKRRKTGPRKTGFDIEAVLSGRRRVSSETVVSMIQEVNPTGKGASPAEEQLRYQQKRALQNLLVERFGDELRVTPDAYDSDLVLVHHGISGNHACHLKISELREEARSWVQFQLDTARGGRDSAEEAPSVSEGTGAADVVYRAASDGTQASLVAEGRAALDAYDYETARCCFEAAFHQQNEDAGVASALLELLVDYLADYPTALKVGGALETRGLLCEQTTMAVATAAARLARFDDACRYCALLSFEASGPVYWIMAERAVTEAEPETVRRFLEEAVERQADPIREAAVERRLEARLAKLRAPAEAALEALWQQGDVKKAEARAEAILARFKESPTARKVLRAIHAKEREAVRAAATARAREAEADGNWGAAERALREVVSLGGDTTLIAARLDAIAVRRAEEASASQVREAGEALGGDDAETALLRYRLLDAPLREKVRFLYPSERLERLERATSGQTKKNKFAEAVSAVLTLERALTAVSKGDFHEAERLLPRLSSLDAFPEVRQLREIILVNAAEVRLKEMSSTIERAAKLVEDAPEECLELLTCIDEALLNAAQREAAVGLRGRATRLRERRAPASEVSRGIAADDPILARNAAMKLVALDAENRAQWEACVAEQDARATQKLQMMRFEIENTPDAPSVGCYCKGSGSTYYIRYADRLLAAEVRSDLIYFKSIDVNTGRVCDVSTISPGKDRPYLRGITVDGDTLFVELSNGDLLQIDYPTWNVEEIHHLREYLPAHHTFRHCLHVPKSSIAWLSSDCELRTACVRIIDLQRKQTLNVVGEADWNIVYKPGDDPFILLNRKDEVLEKQRLKNRLQSVYRGDGTPVDTIDFSFSKVVAAISHVPTGLTVLVIFGSGPFDRNDYLELAAAGADIPSYKLPGSRRYYGCQLGADRETGLLFALAGSGDNAKSLCAVRLDAAGFDELWHLTVSDNALICTDEAGEQPLLLFCDWRGFEIHPLGIDPPKVEHRPPRPPEAVPMFMEWFWSCKWPSEEENRRRDETAKRLRKVSDEDLESYVVEAAKTATEDPDELLSLGLALLQDRFDGYEPDPSPYGAFRNIAERHHYEHLALGMCHATDALKRRSWEEMRRILLRLNQSGAPESALAHRFHLLGMAYYALGEEDNAQLCWEWASIPKGPQCRVADLMQLTAPLPTTESDTDERAQATMTPTLKAVLLTADAALAKGDFDEFLRALDRRIVWFCQEIQSISRLAWGLLQSEPSRIADVVRRAEVFSIFLANTDSPCDNTFSNNLKLSKGEWSLEKIRALRDEVEAKHRDWLTQMFSTLQY